MSFALSAGVSGLQAHQQMLDVAGNNLANVNTTAYKSHRIIFSELLSETIKKASQPTSTIGGTNPQQMGSGVGVAGTSPNMSQGNIVNTGNPLDMAIEGEGFFVLSDGQRKVYTRAGTFAVDANSNLVDPATGFLVQRIGSTGEADTFQRAGDSHIRIPYDVAMAAKATTSVTVAGNLSADQVNSVNGPNKLASNVVFTENSGTKASSSTKLIDLDQCSSGTLVGSTITITGYDHDGNALTPATVTLANTTTLSDVVTALGTALGSTNAKALFSDGQIVVTDVESGYSKSDVKLTFNQGTATAELELPSYFEIANVGGEAVQDVSITVYDSQGGRHTLSGAFVRTATPNMWDMVLTSITGNVHSVADRRIEGIQFDTTGYYSGLDTSVGDTAMFEVAFDHDKTNTQKIQLSLGTPDMLDGLTQFAGNSTAVARGQDGYESGKLSTVSVNNEGILIGAFSNGVKKEIAALQVALFQNTTGMESIGNGYFIPSANSGDPAATQALSGGAGSIHGGALEKSNADVATEFVTMIEAQNGFQANARTIRVANDILRELTNLIR